MDCYIRGVFCCNICKLIRASNAAHTRRLERKHCALSKVPHLSWFCRSLSRLDLTGAEADWSHRLFRRTACRMTAMTDIGHLIVISGKPRERQAQRLICVDDGQPSQTIAGRANRDAGPATRDPGRGALRVGLKRRKDQEARGTVPRCIENRMKLGIPSRVHEPFGAPRRMPGADCMQQSGVQRWAHGNSFPGGPSSASPQSSPRARCRAALFEHEGSHEANAGQCNSGRGVARRPG